MTPSIQNSRGQAAPSRWQGDVKRLDELTASEIALWQHLTATRHELRSPFFSFEFARAVADAGARARVCLLYENGTLAGLFPFQFAGGFTQAMAAGERIGGTLNDFCGVLIDRSRHGAVNSSDLLRCARLASFEFSHLEETQLEAGLSGVRSDGARIRLADGLERYWASVKCDHGGGYNTLRKRERKIEREFQSVDFVFAHSEPTELLKLVMAEKRKQYGRTGAEGEALARPWMLRCLGRIAKYRQGRCIPMLSSLYLDGSWAAYHLGIRAGNVLHYWFPVYNPQFSGLSHGLILLAKMIRAAPSHGIDEIDLGEGLSQYKNLLASEIYPVDRGVWYRTTPRGLAYRGYLSLRWRVQRVRKRRS